MGDEFGDLFVRNAVGDRAWPSSRRPTSSQTASGPGRSEEILGPRASGIQKIGDGCDELRWGERLAQQNAIRHALG